MKKKSITEQIKTYEDACAYNGNKPMDEKALMALGITAKQIAGIKLEEITLALNEGAPTNIFNGKYRHYPWFYSREGSSAFAFYNSYCVCSAASAGSGSRLSYHEEKNSDYSGKQFLELWEEYLS